MISNASSLLSVRHCEVYSDMSLLHRSLDRASRLRVIEGWCDRERLQVRVVGRSVLLCSRSVILVVAHD